MAMYAPDIANIVPMAIIIGSIRASRNSGGSILITLSTKASWGLIAVVVLGPVLRLVVEGVVDAVVLLVVDLNIKVSIITQGILHNVCQK